LPTLPFTSAERIKGLREKGEGGKEKGNAPGKHSLTSPFYIFPSYLHSSEVRGGIFQKERKKKGGGRKTVISVTPHAHFPPSIFVRLARNWQKSKKITEKEEKGKRGA